MRMQPLERMQALEKNVSGIITCVEINDPDLGVLVSAFLVALYKERNKIEVYDSVMRG